jgi:hypothetical protein
VRAALLTAVAASMAMPSAHGTGSGCVGVTKGPAKKKVHKSLWALVSSKGAHRANSAARTWFATTAMGFAASVECPRALRWRADADTRRRNATEGVTALA